MAQDSHVQDVPDVPEELGLSPEDSRTSWGLPNLTGPTELGDGLVVLEELDLRPGLVGTHSHLASYKRSDRNRFRSSGVSTLWVGVDAGPVTSSHLLEGVLGGVVGSGHGEPSLSFQSSSRAAGHRGGSIRPSQ